MEFWVKKIISCVKQVNTDVNLHKLSPYLSQMKVAFVLLSNLLQQWFERVARLTPFSMKVHDYWECIAHDFILKIIFTVYHKDFCDRFTNMQTPNSRECLEVLHLPPHDRSNGHSLQQGAHGWLVGHVCRYNALESRASLSLEAWLK